MLAEDPLDASLNRSGAQVESNRFRSRSVVPLRIPDRSKWNNGVLRLQRSKWWMRRELGRPCATMSLGDHHRFVGMNNLE